jgi:hypothetical protein
MADELKPAYYGPQLGSPLAVKATFAEGNRIRNYEEATFEPTAASINGLQAAADKHHRKNALEAEK